MLDHVLASYEFNLRNAHHVVAGLTPEQCVAQPAGLLNHAAWSIGHIALTSEVMAIEMGGDPAFPSEWMDRFFPGAPITGVIDDYPAMEELLAQLDAQHQRVAGLLPGLSSEQLVAMPAMELIQRRFSRLADFLTYAMIGHEAFHIGQIACTRRALGLENTDL